MHRIPILAICATLIGCSPSANVEDELATASVPKKLSAVSLSNLVQLHRRVISGGVPEGDRAFQELQTLGVKTVISVDGATPDVKTAAKYGLRYVHLPIGYDGISDDRVQQLAKAVRELDGIIYIHCHHGKHRSPAAASVACVSAGMLPHAKGLAVLQLAGTSRDYRGLYKSVREARPLAATLLDELDVEFREMVDVPPMAEAMVAIERTHDHLMAIAAARWRIPSDHPDLDPAHEALLLREHFSELLRSDYVQREHDDFKRLLQNSEQAARGLESALRAWRPATTHELVPVSISRFIERISADCKACHRRFRDVPWSKK